MGNSQSPVTASNERVIEYVEYLEPGSFFPEEYVEEVQGRTLQQLAEKAKPRVFCFTTYKVTVGEVTLGGKSQKVTSNAFDKSKCVYIDGNVYTLAELKEQFPENEILISNMEGNRWDRIIRCRTGNWQPFEKGDKLYSLKERRVTVS
jgi:hypothetical protein